MYAVGLEHMRQDDELHTPVAVTTWRSEHSEHALFLCQTSQRNPGKTELVRWRCTLDQLVAVLRHARALGGLPRLKLLPEADGIPSVWKAAASDADSDDDAPDAAAGAAAPSGDRAAASSAPARARWQAAPSASEVWPKLQPVEAERVSLFLDGAAAALSAVHNTSRSPSPGRHQR